MNKKINKNKNFIYFKQKIKQKYPKKKLAFILTKKFKTHLHNRN